MDKVSDFHVTHLLAFIVVCDYKLYSLDWRLYSLDWRLYSLDWRLLALCVFLLVYVALFTQK
jgi:hypothetical protein